MRRLIWVFALTILLGYSGCSGNDGSTGPAGEDAVSTGTIQGKVMDSVGNPVDNATVDTSPVTTTVTTDAEGIFALTDIPIGAYEVKATKTGMGSATLMCGVAGGGTMSVTLTLAMQPSSAPAEISGFVKDVNGAAVQGATVAVEGQNSTATTVADGSFALTGVSPGFAFLYVTSPSDTYLDGETREALLVEGGSLVSGVEITLSGRPGAGATSVGKSACQGCHGGTWPELFAAIDGSPNASIHSRFVTEGTSHLAYKDLWPLPGDKYLPRAPNGNLLMVQDPLDGEGLVNLTLCTRDGAEGREYLFKFYPEQPGGISLTEADLDCSSTPAEAVWIPVAATIGGEGNWGEGYVDPGHATPDRNPNFGEGKQRYMCRIQDVPYLVAWMQANNVPLDRAKQDYVAYMPVYVVQDGTPDGSAALGVGDVGIPKFWQKSPDHWCPPENTLSRNCAGCHATGVRIAEGDITDNNAQLYKSVVTSFDYKDLNISCERCHGPGSEHASTADKTKIIIPRYLTAKAGNELCGQCHGSHAGKSQRPEGIHKYPFDNNHLNALGNGFFVPGVYDLATFYFNFDMPTPNVKDNWQEGTFHSWPDQTHSRAHSQMLSEVRRSIHNNNSYEKLTCYRCHDAHTLDSGPASLVSDGYDFKNAAYGNNTLCLVCHATHGPFQEISKDDVAVLQLDAGSAVTKDGVAVSVAAPDAALARNRIARTMAEHMQVGAGMGGALYSPANPDMPVGNCASCHMAKIGKLMDVNDDAQFHLALDKNGMTAVAEGNVASHVFDIVWPSQSAILKNPDPAAGHDYDIMPNSCSKCHDFARISGDND
ncbi:MAG: carboxypeptidase regulatory-like domain-containing protein [Candidatus Deferrimicrobiaceae bacterium]